MLNGLFGGESGLAGAHSQEDALGSPSELSKKMKSSEWLYANRVPMSSLYRFGEFVLDPGKRTLSRADSPLFLNPRAMDVLIFLVQNPNRLVTKEELLDAVWGDAFVEEGNLTQSISHLRKALGDNSEDTRLIVTIPRKGYQFAGDVTIGEAADLAKQATVRTPATNISRPETRTDLEFPTQQVAQMHRSIGGKLWSWLRLRSFWSSSVTCLGDTFGTQHRQDRKRSCSPFCRLRI